jgi:hypothetical protein
LKLEDVIIIHNYRQEFLPEISKRARSFDIIAVEAIFNGLLAYGWTWDEITSSRTPLIDQLRIHLKSHNSSLDIIRQANLNKQPIDVQLYLPPSPPYQESSKKRKCSYAQSRNEENIAPLQSDSKADVTEHQGGKSSYIRIALTLANKGTENTSDSQISTRVEPHILASENLYAERGKLTF